MASQGTIERQNQAEIDNVLTQDRIYKKSSKEPESDFENRTRLYNVLLYNPYLVHDGEQCLYKTARLAATGAIIGAYASVIDLTLYKGTPLTNMLALGKFVKWTVPMASIGAAYSTTICVSSHLRGNTSDELNHAFGGVAIGAIIGAKTHNLQLGCWMALGFGIVCSIIKHGTINNWWDRRVSLNAPRERPLWYYKTAFFTTRPNPVDTEKKATQ